MWSPYMAVRRGKAPALAHPACQDSPLSSWAACLSTSNFPAALRNQPYSEPPPTPRPKAIRAQNSQAAEPWRARSQNRERRVGRRPGPCFPWLFAYVVQKVGRRWVPMSPPPHG